MSAVYTAAIASRVDAARAAIDRGDFQSAQAAIESFDNSQAGELARHHLSFLMFAAQGDPARAEPHIVACLAQRQQEFLRDYCGFYFRFGRPDRAIVELERLLRQNDHAVALDAIEYLAARYPQEADLMRIKAAALSGLGRHEEALRVAVALPDHRLDHIANTLAQMERVDLSADLENELGRILDSDQIFHPRLMRVLLSVLREKIHAWEQQPLSPRMIERDRFFHALLRRLDLPAVDIEKYLTMLRRRLLRDAVECRDDSGMALDTMLSIAVQCHGNEYAYYVDTEEKQWLQHIDDVLAGDAASDGSDPDSLIVPVLACLMYVSPASAEWPAALESIDFSVVHPATERFLRATRESHREEMSLARTFEAQNELDDEISLRVGAMYEENPYPRWRSAIPAFNPGNQSIVAHEKLDAAPGWDACGSDVRSVLVAGCGTGLAAVTTAANFPGLSLTAIDISCRSLAYAAMMARKFAVANIEFERRDILQLPSWGNKFDMIEAGGVLHHMRDPDEGLRALLECLRPGGILKIGLYSERARAAIIRFRRDYRAGLGGVNADEIREVRHRIISHIESEEYAEFASLRDFYSTSGCRDLLLHEQEVQFTIPKIVNMLAMHRLRFLRFADHGGVYEALRSLLGADADIFDLANWHAVEAALPSTFAGMYVLFAQSID